MTAPITPDERAALRETVATLDAAWEVDDPTRPLVTEHATLTMLAHVASAVPRLLDALDIANAYRDEAFERIKVLKDEVRRVDNFLRLEREAARRNFERAEKAEAEVDRLLAEHTASSRCQNAACASCTHAYIADLERRVQDAEAARPAPVWDEDAVTESVTQAMMRLHECGYLWTPGSPDCEMHGEPFLDTYIGDVYGVLTTAGGYCPEARRWADTILAVVREHGPVKPDRETLSALLLTFLNPPKHKGGSWTYNPDKAADAVLAEWSGQSRAEVQAEALRAYAADLNLHRAVEDGWEKYGDDLCGDHPDPCLFWDMTHAEQKRINDLADRLDPKGA